MRKLALAAICSVLALALTGCGNTDVRGSANGRFYSTFGGVGVCVITDSETGVKYLFAKSGYGGGLCPLLNADGTPYVEQSDNG